MGEVNSAASVAQGSCSQLEWPNFKLNKSPTASSAAAAPDFGHLLSSDLVHAASGASAAARMPSAHDALFGGEDGRFLSSSGGGALLAHDRRSLWGQCSYNIGYSYFGGLAAGGLFGVAHGVRHSPNAQPRILLNSVLNAAGKFGARAGNAAGVLALLYTVTERQLEDLEVDKLPGTLNELAGRDLFERGRVEALVPAATAFTTGVLFSLPRAVSMRGVERLHVGVAKRGAVLLVGGLACTLGVTALASLAPLVFGQRSPFRFA